MQRGAMNYTDSISDFFKSPHWAMNMVFGGLCMLIPIIGPIVLLGWLVTGFWGRQDQSYETFPAFDFSHFGKYLERGLWPFLVLFVASMAVSYGHDAIHLDVDDPDHVRGRHFITPTWQRRRLLRRVRHAFLVSADRGA